MAGPYLFALQQTWRLGRSGFTLAKDLVLSALVPAGASVLDARKEKRRERCALCELNLLVNMNPNPKHKPVKP